MTAQGDNSHRRQTGVGSTALGLCPQGVDSPQETSIRELRARDSRPTMLR
jgi:hypothetical protein